MVLKKIKLGEIVLFVSLVLLTLGSIKSEQIACEGIVFHDVYYDKKLLANNLGRPCNLFMHKFSGMLFFSHTIHNGTDVDFEIMSCQVAKHTCVKVPGIPGGYAIAYDSGNDDIYFGGHDGIYKYNFLTKTADFFAEDGKSIWGLFVRKNFYYIAYPSQKLYVYRDDKYVQVSEAVYIEIDHFFVSNRGNIYYANRTALFKVDKLSGATILLNDEISVRQILDDSYGDIYFCANDGIYLEDRPYHRVKRIAKIEDAFGMTFDGNENVVYSDRRSIYRLDPNKHNDICYDALQNPEKHIKIDNYNQLMLRSL